MISLPRKSTLLCLDVHKLTIAAGILAPDVPVVDQLSSDPESVRRLVGRFPDPRRVVACYEAGPTGYELASRLSSCQHVFQRRSLSGLRTAQIRLTRPAARSNAKTVTMTPSCRATRPGWPLTVCSRSATLPADRLARSTR